MPRDRRLKVVLLRSEQVTFYDDGVGADVTGLDRLLDGAFGQGLLQKIMDGYTKIAHVFNPGDSIFLFGFSRGAYTARNLAGMTPPVGCRPVALQTIVSRGHLPHIGIARIGQISSQGLLPVV